LSSRLDLTATAAELLGKICYALLIRTEERVRRRRRSEMTHVGHGVGIEAAIDCEQGSSGPVGGRHGTCLHDGSPLQEGVGRHRLVTRGVAFDLSRQRGLPDEGSNGDHDDPSVFRFWRRGVSKRELDLIDKLTALRAQVDEVVQALMPAPVGARGQLGLDCQPIWTLPEGNDELLRENDEEAAAYIGQLFEKRTLQLN
jgi:hypothetical protein